MMIQSDELIFFSGVGQPPTSHLCDQAIGEFRALPAMDEFGGYQSGPTYAFYSLKIMLELRNSVHSVRFNC